MQGLEADQLEQLIARTGEKKFLIVDVRKEKEFRLDHIPGAINIPLAEIEFYPFASDTRTFVFYCRRGVRSKVAAILAMEVGVKTENIFHLTGGMMAYCGEILLDIPRVAHFPSQMTLVEVMEKSINFEKGAFLFYDGIKQRFEGTDLYPVIEKMCRAEVDHGKIIFKMLDAQKPSSLAFKPYFDRCSGDILEGGKSLGEINRFLDGISPENSVDILEFAIELEFCAYDLYKTMAENSKVPGIKEMFFILAQAEKKHLSIMIKSLELIS
jgi:rhodanese-related sulfurtransferase/rubrerythrin